MATDMPDGRIDNSHPTLINLFEALGDDPLTVSTDLTSALALLVHPDDQNRFGRALQEFFASEERVFEIEIRVRHQDGSDQWRLARGVAVRNSERKLVRFVGTSIDVTDLKQAEEALRESEERFRGTLENAAVGIAHEDLTGRFLRLNGRFCAILGYPSEELVGKTLSEVTHPEDLAADLANFGALTRGETSSYTMEKRFIRKDGTPVWAQLTVSLRFDAAGKPTYCIKIIQDITDRKRAEEALRESEQRFRGTFENAHETSKTGRATLLPSRRGRWKAGSAGASPSRLRPFQNRL
jgi:PAS domain S-box-containing protein